MTRQWNLEIYTFTQLRTKLSSNKVFIKQKRDKSVDLREIQEVHLRTDRSIVVKFLKKDDLWLQTLTNKKNVKGFLFPLRLSEYQLSYV